ncbi:MAG: Gfo/Idh/MocA family oxidoreductase [Candidatus Omnitrophica bacterium]|nr:Gfo/Idh/MocA family oxidoreductase [Candidatus Omnitrophota bacterium]MCA9446110.1 Gfo/Idh/MocA family oxidoreductase [Candidatus Omnitrophota bacterium]
MSQIGAGIVGSGWVAEEYIKAFQKDERSEVRSIYSRSKEKPEGYKKKYDLSCDIESDFETMLKRDDIDVVVIATPHDRHTEYVIPAAEAGKHLIIEKPVALTWEEVRRQEEAVRKAGVKTVISFVLRWNPLLMTIDNLIAQGVFGDIFMVEVDYFHRIWWGPSHWLGTKDHGGTSMLAAGCHAVDALRWFAREEAREVTAYQVKTDNPNEYPGTTNAIVQFQNGATGRTTSCFDAQMPYRFNIGIYGTDGVLRNDQVFAPKLFPGQTDFMKIPTILPDSGDVAHHPFQGEVSHLLDCIVEGRRPMPDLEDAARTMALCMAADRSAEEGKAVSLDEFK